MICDGRGRKKIHTQSPVYGWYTYLDPNPCSHCKGTGKEPSFEKEKKRENVRG